jgi:hypothetical protein
MSRKALLVVLTVSLGLFGGMLSMAQNTPAPQTAVPMQLNPYYLYPSNVEPVPMLVTPTARFDSPAPAAGISNAGRAGISVNTGGTAGVTSTLPPSTMVYTNMEPTAAVPVTAAPEATGAAPPAAAPESGGRAINDMGPSYYSDVLPGPATVSLGEVAAKLKAAKGAVNARMLTNDDIGKMAGSQTGVTLAKNMPPLGSSVSGLMAPQGPQGGQPPQSSVAGQAGTPPPATGAQGQPQTPNAANATTPQVNQPQTHDTQGTSRLPATSTWLPLLGILGAMSGAAGLWFRRLRK